LDINYSEYLLTVKSSRLKNGIGGIGIDKFDVELTKWKSGELDLTKWN